VGEVAALWLGAANPLLLMHLVAGIHNEALMLGLMLTGTELALRGIDASAPLIPQPPHWPRVRADWSQWAPLAMLVAGTVLITLSSQVKLPGLLAVGFTAMALAHRWGGTVRAFLSAGVLSVSIALAVMAVVGWASGLGFGWLFTLGTANVVRSWMSPPTLVALATGQVGILLGLGDHTTAVLSLTRAMGVMIIAIVVSWLLLAVMRGGHRAAVPGGSAVVPAVGDHPAGRVGHPAGLPHRHDRRHPDRRDLRPDRQRRPVRPVPDPRRHPGQRTDRAATDLADPQPAAVAVRPGNRRGLQRTGPRPGARSPARNRDTATTGTGSRARRLR
jgi:hypothetical protein